MYQFCLSLLVLFNSIAFSQTTVNSFFVHNGLTRFYSFYVPSIYNGTKAFPLVLNLHGYGSNGSAQSVYGNFTSIADTAGFIVVHPEGSVEPGTGSTQFWNVGFDASTVDDVGFLVALIDTISTKYLIDPNRVYATGMSNGGFMCYKLACETTRFAAIASVAGSMFSKMKTSCGSANPISVMCIHGTADAIVPYNGNASFLSIDSVLNFWSGVNAVSKPPVMTPVPNIMSADASTAEHYMYTGQDGISMELFKVLNGGHAWPGAPIAIDITCMDFSASKEIWRFFHEHKSAKASLNTLTEKDVLIYPIPAENTLFITLKNETNTTVELTDIRGTLVRRLKNPTEIDLTDMAEGQYIVTIQSAWGIIVKRFNKL
jgi:polyhydroxybutyrate depolymerase